MYSMTGFGRSAMEIDGRKITIELKSVNHRYLDINMRLHRSVSFAEDTIRNILKEKISRGHIDVYLFYENIQEDAKIVETDLNLAKSYFEAVEKIRDTIKNKERISALEIAKMPDVLSVQAKEDDEDAVADLISRAVTEAVDGLLEMRKHEGDKQKIDFYEKIDLLEELLKNIIEIAPTVVEEYKAKLTARISELISGTNVEVDPNRLSTEVAIFADKSSIDEEITRLGSHMHLLKSTLDKDEPIGRQLDFIVQEVNREVNTICSKSSNTDITKNALEMKNTVEKIREQVQNIE
ncbi:MAG: YicC/YloC family endoribonuclease [Eubacteriales bacterium]